MLKRGRGRPPKKKEVLLPSSAPDPSQNNVSVGKKPTVKKNPAKRAKKSKEPNDGKGNELFDKVKEVQKGMEDNAAEFRILKESICSEVKSLKKVIENGLVSPGRTQIFFVEADRPPEKDLEKETVFEPSPSSSGIKIVKEESLSNDQKSDIKLFEEPTGEKPKILKKFRPPTSKYRLKEQEQASKFANVTKEKSPEPSTSSSTGSGFKPVMTSKFFSLNAWLARTNDAHFEKNSSSLQKMLTREGLISTFKCMSTACSYTSLSQRYFERHLKFHEEMKVTDFLYYCPYCFFKGESISSLMDHYMGHSNDKYQCGYCFYRSVSDHSCWEHVKTFHSRKPELVYECPLENVVDNQITQMRLLKSRSQNVQPLKCSSEI